MTKPASAITDPQFFCQFEIDDYTQSIGSTLLTSFYFIKEKEAKEFFIEHVQNMITDAIKKNLPLNLDALFLMSSYRNINQLIKFFVDQGADLNAVAENGSTPLIFAADYNNFDIVKLLIEKGADVFLTNMHKKGALEYARVGTHTHMYLMRHINKKRQQRDEIVEENNQLKQKLALVEAELTKLRGNNHETAQPSTTFLQPTHSSTTTFLQAAPAATPITSGNFLQDKHISVSSDDVDDSDDDDSDSGEEVVYRRSNKPINWNKTFDFSNRSQSLL